ncbi:hypothetical protein [Pelagicoccus albus]|uniref:Uncharacterized protein n=1 Tax=Pelagicoccus albus TaxID=415222 RepID=A0A7X1B6Y6_9BACT|nr:hypothetical protein [Pelagicoccus albus]MBC2605518.1 hypothetical protein [Pelagicoccus albus]
MPLVLLKVAKWLLSKGAVLLLAGGVAVCVFALWIFIQKSYSSEGERVTELASLQERASELYAKLELAHSRLIEVGEDLEETRRRLEAAQSVIEYFDGILNRIERFITMSAAERAESEARLEEAKKQRDSLASKRKELLSEQAELRVDRIAFSEEARSLESRIGELELESSDFLEHLEESWTRLKPYLIVSLASIILVPIAWKLFAFYLWAPLLTLAGPIRLLKHDIPAPSLSSQGVSVRVQLQQENRLWVKESYLQASDESLKRRTRFLLNWSFPATCLAAGLTEMVEFSQEDEGEGSVTVSPQRKAELEVALLEVPEGSQVVVRPSCIAGLVSRGLEQVKISRRWRLFHPQAWLTFQFRYFIFEGPCALIVSGVRGVRFETLDTKVDKGRRSNQIATIGFTPNLAYGVVRAETFWTYFRGFNPLFDDVFRGRGVFLCQEISEEETTGAARFWGNFWSSVLKVLGV